MTDLDGSVAGPKNWWMIMSRFSAVCSAALALFLFSSAQGQQIAPEL